jgi:hypothetical protein
MVATIKKTRSFVTSKTSLASPSQDWYLMEQSTDNNSISSLPDKYYTHFIQIIAPNKKGQARFSCRTCSHEFTCSGKRRRIQHILGKDYCLGKERNVVPCPKPFLPLKQALLELHMSLEPKYPPFVTSSPDLSSHSSASGDEMEPLSLDLRSREPSVSEMIADEDEEFLALISEMLPPSKRERTSSFPDFQRYEEMSTTTTTSNFLNHDIPTPVRYSSYSTSSFPSSLSAVQHHPGFSTSYNQWSPSPVSLPSSFQNPFYSQAYQQQQVSLPVHSFTASSLPSPRFQPTYVKEEPNVPLQTVAPAENRLNQAITDFFTAYSIPLDAVESPAFVQLMESVKQLHASKR